MNGLYRCQYCQRDLPIQRTLVSDGFKVYMKGEDEILEDEIPSLRNQETLLKRIEYENIFAKIFPDENEEEDKNEEQEEEEDEEEEDDEERQPVSTGGLKFLSRIFPFLRNSYGYEKIKLQ